MKIRAKFEVEVILNVPNDTNPSELSSLDIGSIEEFSMLKGLGRKDVNENDYEDEFFDEYELVYTSLLEVKEVKNED